MSDPAAHCRTLTETRSWQAVPIRDPFAHFLRFFGDGGEFVYGHGQTIYAVILCRWLIRRVGILTVEDLESPPRRSFTGFVRRTRIARRRSPISSRKLIMCSSAVRTSGLRCGGVAGR